MVEIDWKLALSLAVAQGVLILAAAKSIFVTKSKIYDDQGITIFVPRVELRDICNERRKVLSVTFENAMNNLNKIVEGIVKKHDVDQKILYKRFDELSDNLIDLRKGQSAIERGLSNIYGLLEKKSDV